VGSIPDPKDIFPDVPGTDQRVRSFVETQSETRQLLTGYQGSITTDLILWKGNSSSTTLRICFVCSDGLQRSVAVAEIIANWLGIGGVCLFPIKIRHPQLGEERIWKLEE